MKLACKVCKSSVFEEQLRNPCPKCNNVTCIYCNKVCDICLKSFCFEHVRVRKAVIPTGGIQLMKLCEFCKEIWEAK